MTIMIMTGTFSRYPTICYSYYEVAYLFGKPPVRSETLRHYHAQCLTPHRPFYCVPQVKRFVYTWTILYTDYTVTVERDARLSQ